MTAEALAWWWARRRAGSAQAFEHLLDLKLGPVAVPTGRRAGPGLVTQAPGGLSLRQDVFLTTAHDLPISQQLDSFAHGVATGHAWDGVTCLAGVRGAGKSTVLNRIDWFCQQPSEVGPPPLFLRFDLGMSFNHERFARDFADQICREARRYCDEGPFASRMPALTAMIAAIGNVGRWCETNIRWAGVITLLLFGLVGASLLYAPERSPAQPSVVINAGDRGISIDTSTAEPASSGAAGLLDPLPSNSRIDLPLLGEWKIADIHLLGLALIAVLLIGSAHGLRRTAPRWLRPGSARGWQWIAALALVVPMLIGVNAVYLWVVAKPPPPGFVAAVQSEAPGPLVGPDSAGAGSSDLSLSYQVLGSQRSAGANKDGAADIVWLRDQEPPIPGFNLLGAMLTMLDVENGGKRLLEATGVDVTPKGRVYTLTAGDDWYRILLLPFVVSIFCIMLAIWFMPRWWEHYLRFRQLTQQLQSPDDGRLIPLPYVGAILAQVLPKSEDHEELDKMSMPFLQWRTKQALEECVRAFGRVVILVDDADILPSEQFHELLRVLRPISKVDGARCVVSVPDFFFDVWKSARPNDAHSTIGHCLFLGDPGVYVHGNDAPFKAKLKGNVGADMALTRADLRQWLVELLRSRLRSPLADDTPSRDLIGHAFFMDALVSWGFSEGPEDDEAQDLQFDEEFFLEQRGLSRREWLRKLDERLPRELGYPVGALSSPQIEQDRAKRIEDARREFEAMENFFRCDARWRSEVEKAKRSLDANGHAAESGKAASQESSMIIQGAAPNHPAARDTCGPRTG